MAGREKEGLQWVETVVGGGLENPCLWIRLYMRHPEDFSLSAASFVYHTMSL